MSLVFYSKDGRYSKSFQYVSTQYTNLSSEVAKSKVAVEEDFPYPTHNEEPWDLPTLTVWYTIMIYCKKDLKEKTQKWIKTITQL